MIHPAGGWCRTAIAAIVFLLVVASSAHLSAQERLTTETLSLWSASGGAPVVDKETGAIMLPVEGQLARGYPADSIAMRVVTRPFFSARADGWQALEIGPASLSFVRAENGGGVVLLGDVAIQLPDAIEVGSDGRSVRPLDLLFNYDRTAKSAIVIVDGVSHSVSASSWSGEIAVALSAGGEADWVIDTLEVEAGASLSGSTGEIDEADSAGSIEPTGTDPTIELTGVPDAVSASVLDAALLKIEAGDLEGAADLLGNATAPKGTLAWYQLCAMTLVGRAEELKAAGEYRAYRRVSFAAVTLLVHSLKAAGAAAQPGERAEVLALSAYIQDDHLGNRAVARLNYRRTLEEFPEHEGAKEALARFDEEDDKAQRIRLGRDGQ